MMVSGKGLSLPQRVPVKQPSTHQYLPISEKEPVECGALE